MAETILVRKRQENLWQWREVTSQGTWRSDSFYIGDIDLLTEAIAGKIVWCILPGTDIASQLLPAEIKDRGQLLKTLPFEVEEGVIDPIENLHFAFGLVESSIIPVAYGNAELMQEYIDELEAVGAEVQRCLVDYLLIDRPTEGWTLLLEDGIVTAHTDRGVGFAVEQHTAPIYLAALASSAQPAELTLVAEDEQALAALQEILPESVSGNTTLLVETREGSFWDQVKLKIDSSIDFRTGKLGRKLPFNKWWQHWKYPLVATAAAFLVAVGATWIGQYQADQERMRILAQTDEIFRQVVPSGNFRDPERELRNRLGSAGDSSQRSNSVVLLATVAPAIKSMDDVVIRNLRYSLDNGQLQMNIEANSFTTFETLRNKIAETGLEVDIRSANVHGDTHQAQMRVSGAG